MSLKNCERCGRLFSGVDPVCPACLEKDQEEFQRVRDYLREHPDAAVVEVSAATGVEVERLHRWARAGRLEFKQEDDEGSWRCQNCGAPIESGRLCSRCAAELADRVRLASRRSGRSPDPETEARTRERSPGRGRSGSPPASRSGPQVHTIDDIRRRFR